MKVLILLALSGFLLIPEAAAQSYVSVTIANGASLSSLGTLPKGCMPSAIVMPKALLPSADWTAANLTFRLTLVTINGVTVTGNWRDIYKGEITAEVSAADDIIGLDPSDWHWVRGVQVRSGTASSPVNQGAARTLAIVCGR